MYWEQLSTELALPWFTFPAAAGGAPDHYFTKLTVRASPPSITSISHYFHNTGSQGRVSARRLWRCRKALPRLQLMRGTENTSLVSTSSKCTASFLEQNKLCLLPPHAATEIKPMLISGEWTVRAVHHTVMFLQDHSNRSSSLSGHFTLAWKGNTLHILIRQLGVHKMSSWHSCSLWQHVSVPMGFRASTGLRWASQTFPSQRH